MPSSRRSLLGERVLSLIGDEWIGVEELMAKAIPLVPPGKAKRQYAMGAARNDAEREARERAGKKLIARKPLPAEAEQIRMGARNIVSGILGEARDNHVIEVDGQRDERRFRRSDERRFAHHCCLHGGTCRGTSEAEPTTPAVEDDALPLLIQRVLASRAARLAERTVPCPECGRPCRGSAALAAHRKGHANAEVREVVPGEIDRLLRECG